MLDDIALMRVDVETPPEGLLGAPDISDAFENTREMPQRLRLVADTGAINGNHAVNGLEPAVDRLADGDRGVQAPILH